MPRVGLEAVVEQAEMVKEAQVAVMMVVALAAKEPAVHLAVQEYQIGRESTANQPPFHQEARGLSYQALVTLELRVARQKQVAVLHLHLL